MSGARALIWMSLLVAGLASPAWSEQEDPRLQTQIQLRGLQFGNFFEAPADLPKEDVRAVEAQARLSYRLQRQQPLRTYLTLRHIAFEQRGPSSGVGLGLRSDGRPHAFDLAVEYLGDRPSSDVGDEVGVADVLRLQGEYSYRLTRHWQVSGRGDLQRVTFSLTPSRDHDFTSAGTFVRYRGFGYGFQPEVGAMWGRRSVEDPREDHDQRDLFIQVRSVPADALYLSLRLRYRTRDYRAEDPLARNFERQDRRRQWVLTAVVRSHRHLRWLLYTAYETAHSTQPSRVFDTHLVLVGMMLDF